jgi:hypothetical protein
MICVLRKTMNILIFFVVKQTINTPATITIFINRQNARDTAVAVRCVNDLIKILLILLL